MKVHASLCTGIGGLDLGVQAVLGGELLWAADPDRYASQVIDARLGAYRNHGDFRESIGPRVDVLTAGFPCQDISLAGKGAGLDGERSGLWFDVLDVIERLLPQQVVIENVPALKNRGLDVVLAGLEQAGYGGSGGYFRSGYKTGKFAHVGAAHQRKRLFIVAEYGLSGGFVESQPAGADAPAADDLVLFPTPAASAYGSNRGGASGRVGPVRHGLSGISMMLPTPAAWDGSRGPDLARADRQGSGGADLVTTVERLLPEPGSMLPTPTSRDHKGRNQRNDDSCLPGAVDKLLPTATARDGEGSRNNTSGRKPDSKHHSGTTLNDVRYTSSWGNYEAAVDRWSTIFGTPPPSPVDSAARLNPAFVEWMLGFPAGWVTDLNISRSQQLKLLGNSAQPQTVAAAVHWLHHCNVQREHNTNLL